MEAEPRRLGRRLPRWALVVLTVVGVCLAVYLFLVATAGSINPAIVTTAVVGTEGVYVEPWDSNDPASLVASIEEHGAPRYYWTDSECFEIGARTFSERQAIRKALETGRVCQFKVVGWRLPILGFHRRIVAVFAVR